MMDAHIGTIRAALEEWAEAISVGEQIYIVIDADETLRAIDSALAWLDTLQPVNADGLLPCPWCGEHSTVVLAEIASNWFVVQCDVCTSSLADYTRELTIAKWNRRTPQLVTQPSAAQMEDEVYDAIDDALSSWNVEAITDYHNGYATKRTIDERDATVKMVREWLQLMRPRQQEGE